MIKIAYDPAKNKLNITKHGVAFEEIEFFDWSTAFIYEDKREDYGEERRIAPGFIHQRLHVLIYTTRKQALRVISLRKANERERRVYGQLQQ